MGGDNVHGMIQSKPLLRGRRCCHGLHIRSFAYCTPGMLTRIELGVRRFCCSALSDLQATCSAMGRKHRLEACFFRREAFCVLKLLKDVPKQLLATHVHNTPLLGLGVKLRVLEGQVVADSHIDHINLQITCRTAGLPLQQLLHTAATSAVAVLLCGSSTVHPQSPEECCSPYRAYSGLTCWSSCAVSCQQSAQQSQ